MRPQHAIGKDERRRAHARNADALAAKIFDGVNIALVAACTRRHPR
jgi:hypothetical protein